MRFKLRVGRLFLALCAIYLPEARAGDCSSQKLYWTSGQGVLRADLDGSNQETILNVERLTQLAGNFLGYPAWGPGGIAVDASEGKLYTGVFGAVLRTDLDGSNPKFVTRSSGSAEIALDARRRFLYTLGNKSPGYAFGSAIRRIDLDTGDSLVALKGPPDKADSFWAMAVDTLRGRVFGAMIYPMQIIPGANSVSMLMSGNPDGSGAEIFKSTSKNVAGQAIAFQANYLAVSEDDGGLYWTGSRYVEAKNGTFTVADINRVSGSGDQALHTYNTTWPPGLLASGATALTASGNYLFYTTAEGGIYRMGRDGGGSAQLILPVQPAPPGIFALPLPSHPKALAVGPGCILGGPNLLVTGLEYVQGPFPDGGTAMAVAGRPGVFFVEVRAERYDLLLDSDVVEVEVRVEGQDPWRQSFSKAGFDMRKEGWVAVVRVATERPFYPPPDRGAARTIQVSASVDPDRRIAEYNEDDNRIERTVSVVTVPALKILFLRMSCEGVCGEPVSDPLGSILQHLATAASLLPFSNLDLRYEAEPTVMTSRALRELGTGEDLLTLKQERERRWPDAWTVVGLIPSSYFESRFPDDPRVQRARGDTIAALRASLVTLDENTTTAHELGHVLGLHHDGSAIDSGGYSVFDGVCFGSERWCGRSNAPSRPCLMVDVPVPGATEYGIEYSHWVEVIRDLAAMPK